MSLIKRKKTKIKVSRGSLDKERQKVESAMAYQRVLLFLLPLMMVAVLIVGLFFGYKSYQRKYNYNNNKTELSSEEVQDTLSDEDKRYLLTVVNSANSVDKDFVPEVVDFNGVPVSRYMYDDLKKLMDDSSIDGVNIKLTQGYISYEEQKQRYEKAVKDYKKKNKSSTVKAEAAVKKTIPQEGESEQQTGLLVEFSSDSDSDFEKTAEYRWLYKNCENYGFILRYPDKENSGGLAYSPKLYRYVGTDYAKQMRIFNMNLDEFVHYLSVQ